MPRACTICQHQQRASIDQALIGGESIRNVSAQFALKTSTLFRHSKHLASAAAEDRAAQDHGLDLWHQLRAINAACLNVLAHANQSGNWRIVLQASDRVQRQLELSARLLGQLEDGPAASTTTVNVNLEWPSLRGRIVRALEPYPEARQAVLLSLNGHRLPDN